MKSIKNLLLGLVLAAFAAIPGWGQYSLTNTTLSANVDGTQTTFAIASATGVEVDDIAWANGEAMIVRAINGTTLTVRRGAEGTAIAQHTSGDTIYIDLPQYFREFALGYEPRGSSRCTTAEFPFDVSPLIDLRSGTVLNCTSSLVSPQGVTDMALTSPTITTDIRSVTAGTATLGTAALPFGIIYQQGATGAIFEGATADAFETSFAITDPTTPDKVVTFADATGTVMLSSFATNGADVANAVTGASNALLFEGATADAFELSLSPTDVGADVTATLPGGGNAAYALLGSALTTNDVDVANSLWGVSNGLRFEGATADAFEITVSPADTGADVTITLPAATGTAMLSTLATNAPDIANSVYGTSANLAFEGTTADAFETFITVTDPVIDTTITIPAIASGAHTLGQVEVTFHDEVAGNATDRTFFVATKGYIVNACSEIHSVAAGGASTLQVTKETTTGAPGAGTDLLTTAYDLNGTANTVIATAAAGFVSLAARTMATGDRLSVDYANAIQSSAGVMVTCSLLPD